MSSRSGWIEDFSGLPRPVPSGQRQRVVRPGCLQRPLARPDVAQDRDVLARAREWLGERHPVPALHDLRAGHAQAEDEAPATEVIERHRRHRGGGRLARRELHDRGPELELLGRRPPPGQRRQAVRAVGLRGPDRVEPQLFGLEHRLGRAGRRPPGPVAGVQPELQRPTHLQLRPYRLARSGAVYEHQREAVVALQRPRSGSWWPRSRAGGRRARGSGASPARPRPRCPDRRALRRARRCPRG